MIPDDSFFDQADCPVLAFLSPDSRQGLSRFLAEGNRTFRRQKLQAWFQSVDWLAPDLLCRERVFVQWPAGLRQQVLRDVAAYRAQRQSHRQEQSVKREQYRLRVFEYYRRQVPPSDKVLLESLRDYELDCTGRDVNWRHYFTLDSFKKIDAFVQADPPVRQAWFTRFKQDVDTYKRNYDKLQAAHRDGDGFNAQHGWGFDDWCDTVDEQVSGRTQGRRSRRRATDGEAGRVAQQHPVYRAYHTLQLDSAATPEEVKKQFRRLTLAHHPDLPGGDEETMKALVGAYQELRRYWRQAGMSGLP